MKDLTRESFTFITFHMKLSHEEKLVLGNNIVRGRRRKGMTQEQLATAAHTSVRSVWAIESVVPESNPELKTISALAAALKVEVADLFKTRPESELVEI